MGNFAKMLFTLVLLLFFLFTTPSKADIKSFKIRSNDQGGIALDEFEFTRTGHLSVTISSVSVTSMPLTSNLSRPGPSRFGFFLVSDDAINYFDRDSISCDLDSKYITLLFTFKDLSSESSFTKSYNVTYPNWYTLRFSNCNPLTHLRMHVRKEFYNTINGDTKDYLSAGQTNLPRIYFIFLIIYLCCVAVWLFVCFMNRNSSLHWIHLLMGVLLLTKGLNLLFASKVEHFLKVTGTPHDGSNYVLLYVFQFIRNALFYTVITAIIDGCCFSKPEFPVKFFLLIVIPVQIFSTIVSKIKRGVILDESWNLDVGSFVTNFFCVMILIVFIGMAICKTSKTDHKLVNNYLGKLTLIWVFYIVFIVYTGIDFVCGVVGRDWGKVLEIASLVVDMVMYLVFMPSQKTQYFIAHIPVAPMAEVELGC